MYINIHPGFKGSSLPAGRPEIRDSRKERPADMNHGILGSVASLYIRSWEK
jgi:hypothetical protein